MKKFLLLLVMTNVYATTITLDRAQLDQTTEMIKKNGSQAIADIPKTGRALRAVKLNDLDLSATKAEMNQAGEQFKHVKPLDTKLASGQNYYLYSDAVTKDKASVDINQTISDYNAMLKNDKNSIGDNRLLIFISSSMPKRTIMNLMAQASALGAVFVIRGLINGSYVKTYRYFSGLKGKNTVGIMINPRLFKAFKVDVVPTFALYDSKQDLMHTACNVAPSYTKVSGEVTVHYALEQLKLSKVSNLAQIAANEMDILEGSK